MNTEDIRRNQQLLLNRQAAEAIDPRAELEACYGKLWDTPELRAEFSVTGFMAPYVGVVRLADGVRGTMMFSHQPRFYHSFQPE